MNCSGAVGARNEGERPDRCFLVRKGSPLSSDDVEELARRFAVSQQAMTFRLENLGLPLELS